jgi:Co/Zn/Cd efflux system component
MERCAWAGVARSLEKRFTALRQADLESKVVNCCQDKRCEITAMRANHARVLWIVLAINSVMFFIEGAAGLLANSTALLALPFTRN